MKEIIRIANEEALNSSCLGQQVGAVIFDDEYQVVGLGCNHNPKHNCRQLEGCYFLGQSCITIDLPSRAIHAETAAIAYCAKNQITPEGCSIYITHPPCFSCVKQIVAVGIKAIYVPSSSRTSNFDECTTLFLLDNKVSIHYIIKDEKNSNRRQRHRGSSNGVCRNQ